MEYNIRIEPDKLQEFLQIIHSLQNLGVVKNLSPVEPKLKIEQQNIRKFYEQFQFDTQHFKFNREEANER
jgi:hypothetical protein